MYRLSRLPMGGLCGLNMRTRCGRSWARWMVARLVVFCLMVFCLVAASQRAAAQCVQEGQTSGEARRELAALLAQREVLAQADFEAQLLRFAQRVPCVPAAVLPLAETQLAQGKRAAAIATLVGVASVAGVTPQLTAAKALLARLKAQGRVVLSLPDWVPEGVQLRLRPGGEASGSPVALSQDGPRRFTGFVDPGDYALSCEGTLIEPEPTPAVLRVPPATEVSQTVTPTPVFLPVDASAWPQGLQADAQAAEAAALAGDWGGAVERLVAVSQRSAPTVARPRLRFNLAVAHRRAGDPLAALLALLGLRGLPNWAEPFADAMSNALQGELVRVELRASGVALRIDGRAVVAGEQALLLGTGEDRPVPLASAGTLWLSPAPEYRFEPAAPTAHRMVLQGAGRTREVERPGGLTVELVTGVRYQMMIETAAVAGASGAGNRWLGPGLLLGGGVAVGATSLFGFFLPAQRLFDDAGCDSDGRCVDLSKAERAQDRADVATVGSVVSGCLLVGGAAWGVYNLIRGEPQPPASAGRALPGGPGLTVAF